jgi:hypothetical protein
MRIFLTAGGVGGLLVSLLVSLVNVFGMVVVVDNEEDEEHEAVGGEIVIVPAAVALDGILGDKGGGGGIFRAALLWVFCEE